MSAAIQATFPSVAGQQLEKRLWLPEGEPKAILQLVHGMAEYIDRYDETAKQMNEAGFLVVGHTHLGHGPGAQQLGHFSKKNGWDALIDDTHALRKETAAAYPNLPYFLLGHSMGSFVVRTYCLKYEQGLAGVILSGTGHFDPITLGAGKLIANLQCALGSAEKPSKMLERISTSGNNQKYENPRTDFDWISADDAVVDAYLADPYCGFTFTARAYRDMFTGLSRLYPKYLTEMEKDIPVYLFSGSMDPVGKYGEGVKKVAGEIQAAGVLSVSIKLYEGGRHEMFNERDRQVVWGDLILWMENVMNNDTIARD